MKAPAEESNLMSAITASVRSRYQLPTLAVLEPVDPAYICASRGNGSSAA